MFSSLTIHLLIPAPSFYFFPFLLMVSYIPKYQSFCSKLENLNTIPPTNLFLLLVVVSIIFDRLAENGRTYQQATTLHLSNYAEDGFRTLAFAYRKLEVTEYEQWNSIFKVAKTTIGPEREEILEKASEMIEKDLILLGVAAVEDKLQKGVSYLSLRLKNWMGCIYKVDLRGI